jgi:hypothetical protein
MSVRWMVATILVLGLWGKPSPGQEGLLGGKVVEFCKTHRGQQVGSGECSALAYAALQSAGAKTRGKDHPRPGDYTWGRLVVVLEHDPTGPRVTWGKLRNIRAGDIIQFRDTKWEGPGRAGRGRYGMSFGHHTAVIARPERGGDRLRIYQQNYNGKRFVMEGTLYPADLKEGWIRVYRPVPR